MGFMMNLGNFAGGAAKGYEAGTQLQQRQKQIESQGNLQQAQTANLQQNTQQQQVQFQQQQDLKDGLGKLLDQYYPPQQTDADGNVTQPASKYGDDPAKDVAFTRAAIAFQLSKTGDMTKLAPLMQQAQAAANTQEGQELMKATSNDPKAFAAYVTKHGGDPTKAKFNADGPHGPEMDMGIGQPPVNVRSQLYSLGLVDWANAMGNDSLLPAKKAQIEATTNAENARANASNAEASIAPAKKQYYFDVGNARLQASGGGGKLGTQAVSDYTRLAKSNPMVDPTISLDGKQHTWDSAESLRQQVYAQARGATGDSGKAFAQASNTVQQVNQLADQQAKAVLAKNIDKAALKQQYGGSDPGSIKKAIFDRLVAKNFPNRDSAPMGAPPGNVGASGWQQGDPE